MEIQVAFSIAVLGAAFFFLSTRFVSRLLVSLVTIAVALLSVSLTRSTPSAVANLLASIDYRVLIQILGLTLISGLLRKTGVSHYLAIWFAKVVQGRPVPIFLFVSLTTAIFGCVLGPSAAIVLFLPVVLLLCSELDLKPLPFLLAQVFAAQIGGFATTISDPTTMIVSSKLGIDLISFSLRMIPWALVSLAIVLILLLVLFRTSFRVTNERRARILDFDERKSIVQAPLLVQSLSVFALILAGLIAGPWINVDSATTILFGASLLIVVSGRKNAEDTLAELDGKPFVFLAAVLVLGAFAQSTGIIPLLLNGLSNQLSQPVAGSVVLWGSAVVTPVIDKLPFVALASDGIYHVLTEAGIPYAQWSYNPVAVQLWTALSLGANLGGVLSLTTGASTALALSLAGEDRKSIPLRSWLGYSAAIVFSVLIVVTALKFLVL